MNMNSKPGVCVQIHITVMRKKRERKRSVCLPRYDGSSSAEEVLLSKSEKFKVETFLPVLDTLIFELTKHAEAYSQI